MMKRILIAIFLLLTICACEHSEMAMGGAGEERRPIGLSVAVSADKSSRAGAELLRTAADVGSIGLYIYVERRDGSVEVLGENLKLNYVEGSSLWEYDDESVAPEWGYTDGSERYTFCGYAPYRPSAEGITFDEMSGEFSLDYAMSENVDLMVAQSRGIVCPAGGVVTLDLRHTLSAVSLNTTYTSVITKVELVTGNDYHTSMPISGRVCLDASGDVAWSDLGYSAAAARYELSSESRSYVLLLPQMLGSKGDLFFSITSVKNNKVVVDENAQIPAMALASSGVYKFNYKEPYYDVDEDGELVIKVDEILKDSEGWGDYSAIDKVIEKIKEAGGTIVKVTGAPRDPAEAYHVIRHIVQNSGLPNYDLSGYDVPKGTKLPYDLFIGSETIQNVVMPVLDEGQLGSNLFKGCTSLESVIFPAGQGLETLPGSTFNGCTSLTYVVFDKTSDALTLIGQNAFEGCTSLEKIELPASVEELGFATFRNCTALSQVNIPAAMTTIGGQSFMNCVNLYSYGENRGIVFEERTAQDPQIKLGDRGFASTHVRYADMPAGYFSSATSNGNYFSEP